MGEDRDSKLIRIRGPKQIVSECGWISVTSLEKISWSVKFLFQKQEFRGIATVSGLRHLFKTGISLCLQA